MSAEIYATRWIITLFSTDLPLELVFAILDIYIFDRNEIVIKSVLSIIKILKDKLIRKNEDQILEFLKVAPNDLIKDINVFFKELDFFEMILPINEKDGSKDIPKEGKINKSPFSK